MAVLLVKPPRPIRRGNIWQKIDPGFPPLGLACIASYLESKGKAVHILDMQAERTNYPEFRLLLKKINPDFIGISSTTVEIETALDIAGLAKAVLPGAKIVLGGAHPSVMSQEVLSNPEVDFVVRGEGEYTFHELISDAANVSKITGLSYKYNGHARHNPPRPVIANLDEMPVPAYHLLPMKRYKPSLGNYKRLPAMSMITTRGCPGRCTFCYTGLFGEKIRTRSAQKIFEEIKLLKRDYKIREISFYDDTFTAPKENVKQLCRLMVKENIDITWSCMSRIDFIDEEMLSLMKQAGCHQIGYGLESASPDILENIKKYTAPDLMRRIAALTKKHQIDVRVMFMLGNPGETEETMKATIEFAIDLKPDIAIFNITTPFPGTEMYDWAKRNNYLFDVKWRDFDLANVVMRLPTVPAERVMHYYNSAYREFYMRPYYIIKRLSKIRTLTDIKNNIKSFFSILAFHLEAKNEIRDDKNSQYFA